MKSLMKKGLLSVFLLVLGMSGNLWAADEIVATTRGLDTMDVLSTEKQWVFVTVYKSSNGRLRANISMSKQDDPNGRNRKVILRVNNVSSAQHYTGDRLERVYAGSDGFLLTINLQSFSDTYLDFSFDGKARHWAMFQTKTPKRRRFPTLCTRSSKLVAKYYGGRRRSGK